MTSDESVNLVVAAMNRAGIPYMTVGSLSTNFYGIPRGTRDADFVIQAGEHSISSIMAQLGAEFALDPQMSFETVTATTKYVVRVPGSQYKIEFFLLSDDPYDQERFARRRQVRMLGQDVFMPAVEDVIVQKLLWGRRASRRKDLDDVRNVIGLRRNQIDWAYVHTWCDRHNTRDLLDEILREIPP